MARRVAIDLGTRDQIIDGPPVVIHLQTDERSADRQERCPVKPPW